MAMQRRRVLRMAAGAVALSAASRIARAQAYPSRPLRWVIGFPAGGGADIVARIMGRWLSERLGQEVIIENKPGAGTNIAAQTVINSPPDGYTMLWVGSSNAMNATLYESLPFNFLRDIAAVSGLVVYPLVLEVHPAVPAKTVAEFIALCKDNPNKVTLGSYGVGTTSHVAGELFKSMAGITAVHVPYRGGAPMVNDLVGGHLQAAIDVVAASLPHIRSGAARALGIMSSARLAALPDVPIVAETVPRYEAEAWTGIGVPRGTPPEIIDRLNREINAGLVDPAVAARLAELTTKPMIVTPAAFGAYIAAETDKWGKVVKMAGMKAE